MPCEGRTAEELQEITRVDHDVHAECLLDPFDTTFDEFSEVRRSARNSGSRQTIPAPDTPSNQDVA